jgi:hypothetical protein
MTAEPTFWTREKVLEAIEILGCHPTVSEAVAEMSTMWGKPVDRSALYSSLARFGKGKPSDYTRQVTEVGYADSCFVVSKKAELGALKDVYRHLAELNASIPSIEKKKPQKVSGGSAIVILLSDWHIGNGHMGSDVLEERALSIAGMLTVESLKGIDECVCLLAGDFVDGEGIYPGQDVTLAECVLEQAKIAAGILYKLIGYIATVVPVRVVCAIGNHGRTQQSKTANWDNVVYTYLSLLYSQSQSVDVTIGTEYAVTTVKGHTFYVRHKMPAQCETKAAMQKYLGWQQMHGVDFFAFGHVHHYGIFTAPAGGIVLRNGCLCGPNDYSEGLGVTARAAQLIACVGRSGLKWVAPVEW